MSAPGPAGARRRRPVDVNARAVMIAKIATGEIEDARWTPESEGNGSGRLVVAVIGDGSLQYSVRQRKSERPPSAKPQAAAQTLASTWLAVRPTRAQRSRLSMPFGAAAGLSSWEA